jgi:hypothetical protein
VIPGVLKSGCQVMLNREDLYVSGTQDCEVMQYWKGNQTDLLSRLDSGERTVLMCLLGKIGRCLLCPLKILVLETCLQL